ncbi:AAA-like domain-containing protein [Aliarcobacter cryaerophilus]|uniref:AAA-like domain-containing protein n=1 Tax=Aliarcobacter cryaerophilus TaxID=28198 RepID=UPI0021B2D6B9|nr:AAA-like domain-containing protein [Aliarcobacter cryaerophilus]MCT7444619.1 AAA-like domain-containing protein [Aliarcobacter cryaerophilus]MCT7472450.1 AAA-like domain-containing protein [Aliarcobacter cryaerophilus]MCT7479937.1 AAA-like domain-containing protein [Aliarcobacter cryaerophilus]
MDIKINAGIHSKFNLSRFNSDEKIILKNLSKSWYLTSSGEKINQGTSTYNYFLVKPISKFSVMFNIEREIICIFSAYETFEPRTLDILDSITMSLPKNRTENICFMLISKDKSINQKIDKLLKTEIEQPIVIAFSYKDLIDNNNINFEDSFRERFYTRDLFSFLSPLKKDIFFFGRNNLVNEIINKHKSLEHSSLFGLRKSGKTSIVYAIQRRLNIDQSKYLSIDCETPAIHGKRWYELLEKIIKNFDDLQPSKLKIKYENNYLEHNAAENFEKDMHKIYNALGKSHTVIIFDEIERITPNTASSPHWQNEKDFIYFWQTLRGFYQKYPEIFTYMIVGTNPSCLENPILFEEDNPLYLSIDIQYVPNFTLEQVKEMVQKLSFLMGIEIDDLICSKLYEDFGGHPFLIRQICSQLNKEISLKRPTKVDKSLYAKTLKEFISSSHEYLNMIIYVLEKWYSDEYDMLTLLANEDFKTFEEFASNHINYTKHLIGYELVQKGENGYYFNYEILKNHIQNKNKYKRLNLQPKEKLEEISKRRNLIEEGLRTLIKNTLTYSNKDNAKKLVLSSIEEKRREKINTLTIQQLLHKNESPLFLLDLKNIINKNWDIFEKIFEKIDKNRILFLLDDINQYGRPDAHAKKISDDNFMQLRIHFNTLEKILNDWDII